MKLIFSLLVLAFSLLFMSPYHLALRIPALKNNQVFSEYDTVRFTATPEVNSKPSVKPTYESKDKIKYINNLLSQRQLYGLWKSTQKSQSENEEGFASLKYANDYQSYEETFDMLLCIYNGLYTNGNYTCVTFSEFVPFITDDMFNEQEMTLTFNQITVHKSEGSPNTINQLGSECIINSTLYFVDSQTDLPLKMTYDSKVDNEKLGVIFRVHSEECGLDIVTSKMTIEDTLTAGQSMIYMVAMSSFAVIQCALCFGLNKLLQNKKQISEKISQGTLRTIAAFDLYLAMESILQIGSNLFVGSIAFPYAILAIYFEAKAIRTVLEAQGKLSERGLSRLHIINGLWFIVSIFLATISAFFQHPEWMFVLFVLHPIPQIYQNFTTERKYRFNQFFVLLFVLPKFAYMFYVLGFPRNLFRYSPNIMFLTILFNVYLAQLILLLIQNKYPTFCIKGKSEYQFFEVPENGKEVCSICLEELDSPCKSDLNESLLSASTIEPDSANIKPEAKEDKLIMVVTPCKHQFHECCIRDWAKLKNLCPYCRTELPPLPEVDDE